MDPLGKIAVDFLEVFRRLEFVRLSWLWAVSDSPRRLLRLGAGLRRLLLQLVILGAQTRLGFRDLCLKLVEFRIVAPNNAQILCFKSVQLTLKRSEF